MKPQMLAIIFAVFFTGCATTPVNDQLAQWDEIAAEQGALIETGTALITDAILQYGVKNPEEISETKVELLVIAYNLERGAGAAEDLSSGILNPKQLMEQLKVKEDYISRILQAIVPLYSAAWGELRKIDEGENALKATEVASHWVLRIAAGIRRAAE